MATKRRHLKELAADPRFIPGIHNYCDRWCERCPLTSRCLTYALEQETDTPRPAARDVGHRAFWQRLEGILREAHEMLDEMLRERGIQLEPLDAGAEQTLLRLDDDARRHPCALAAAAYAEQATAWLEAARPRLQARGRALETQQRMGLRRADPEAEAERLRDAVEVIQWYQFQIPVKIVRAAGSVVPEDALAEETDRRDADGSAKVALLGIDRSLTAWAEVLCQLPEEEDRLLPILAALCRLRRELEAAFPAARAFRRPGFDTGEAAES